jgi:hypothetical protein
MAIHSKIRGLHVYEKNSGKVEPGDVVSLTLDQAWLETEGTMNIMVVNSRGLLCGHIAAEDANAVGTLLKSGAILQGQVPTNSRRRGGRLGKEIDVVIIEK